MFPFVLASAHITSSSGDVVVDSGSSTTLQVTAEGIPNTITYVWRKNGVTIPGATSNTLTISNISLSDIGQYECIPSNSEGNFNTSTIQLDVICKFSMQFLCSYYPSPTHSVCKDMVVDMCVS